MATATLDITTAGTTLNKLWRKVQPDLLKTIKDGTDEYALLQDARLIPNFKLDVSAREITCPVIVRRGGGVASISEAYPYEARTGSNAPEEVTLTWVNVSARFSITWIARLLDQRNGNVQIKKQFAYQSMEKSQALARRVGESFYGYSTATVCKTSTASSGSSLTLQLIDAYGEAALDNALYLSRFFTQGDRIALRRSNALVANSLGGQITADPDATNGQIAVTFPLGSVTSQAGDEIIFANSLENATLDGGTDHNKWPVGWLDATKSASCQGLATSAAGTWAASWADTAGGRISITRLRKARYTMKNASGLEPSLLIMSQGVENDWFDSERAAIRWEGGGTLDLEGAVKTKEERFTSEKVPSGMCFLSGKGAYRRFLLQDKMPDEEGAGLGWDDGKVQPDMKVWTFPIDLSWQLVVYNRAALGFFSGLQES